MIKQRTIANQNQAGTGDDWFHNMSEKQQKQYIENHPDSKYAKQAGGKGGSAIKDSEKDTPPKKDQIKKVAKVPVKIANSIKKMGAEEAKHLKHFFHGEHHLPGSKERRAFGHAVKAKAKGFLKALAHAPKDTVREAKTAAGAVGKLVKGEKISSKEKVAIAKTAYTLVGVVSTVGAGGMALHHLAGHLAKDFATHWLVESAGSAAVFASADDHDANIQKLAAAFGNYLADADIDPDTWAAAIDQASGDTDKPATKLKPDTDPENRVVTSSNVIHIHKLLNTTYSSRNKVVFSK